MALTDKLSAIGDAIRVQSGKTELLTLAQMPEEIINLQSLNFEVVGNPQPSNPKENTIWVNTDVPIPKWHFNATQPEDMAEGEVLFLTGSSSSAAFNALKKNSLQVYPLSAKQYVGGALVNREAKIYQDGKWNNFDKVLFTIGGDIAEFRIVHNSSASVSVTSDKIVFTALAEFYSDTLCEYPTPLDLSAYSAIEAKVKVTYLVPTYGHFSAYVATTPQHYSSLSSVARAVTTTLNGGMEQILRISLEDDVFDTGLLYVGFNCLGSAEVYDWRLV